MRDPHRRATVADVLTGLYDNNGGTSVGVQGDHGMDGSVHDGHVEGLGCELDLSLMIRSTSLGSCSMELVVKYIVLDRFSISSQLNIQNLKLIFCFMYNSYSFNIVPYNTVPTLCKLTQQIRHCIFKQKLCACFLHVHFPFTKRVDG